MWLTKYPFRTKAISAGCLMGVSDFIAQHREAKHQNHFYYDFPRSSRMALIGTSSGGLMHFWYGFLNSRISFTGSRGAVLKVVIDQGIFAPLALAGFFVATGVMGGQTAEEMKESFADKYVDVLAVNYLIWPISMLINFRYVPPRYQVLWASTISLGWSVYLSTSANKHIASHAHFEEDHPQLSAPDPATNFSKSIKEPTQG